MLSCISEASSLTDFPSSLPMTPYVWKHGKHSFPPSVLPLLTHTHTESKQVIPSATQSPLVAHHPLIHTMTSSTLHSILKFSCLSWRRRPGAGGEAVDHINQSSVVRNYFFYEIFGQQRFGEFRAFSIHMQLMSALLFQQKKVPLIWTDAQADHIIIGHSTGQGRNFRVAAQI